MVDFNEVMVTLDVMPNMTRTVTTFDIMTTVRFALVLLLVALVTFDIRDE